MKRQNYDKTEEILKGAYKDVEPSSEFVEALSSRLVEKELETNDKSKRKNHSLILFGYLSLGGLFMATIMLVGFLYFSGVITSPNQSVDVVSTVVPKNDDSHIDNGASSDNDPTFNLLGASNAEISSKFLDVAEPFTTVSIEDLLPSVFSVESNRCFLSCDSDEFLQKTFEVNRKVPSFKARCSVLQEGEKQDYIVYFQNNMLSRLLTLQGKDISVEDIGSDLDYFERSLTNKTWSSWSLVSTSLIKHIATRTGLRFLDAHDIHIADFSSEYIKDESGILIGKKTSFTATIDGKTENFNLTVDPQLHITSLESSSNSQRVSCTLSDFNSHFGVVFSKYSATPGKVFGELDEDTVLQTILFPSTRTDAYANPTNINNLWSTTYISNVVVDRAKDPYVAEVYKVSPVQAGDLAKYREVRSYLDGRKSEIVIVGKTKYTRDSYDFGESWSDWKVSTGEVTDPYALTTIISPAINDKKAWNVENVEIVDGPSDLTKTLKFKLVDVSNDKHYVNVEIGFMQHYFITSILTEEHRSNGDKPEKRRAVFFERDAEQIEISAP